MKFKLLITGLVLSASSFAVTQQEAIIAYQRIVNANGFSHYPRLVFSGAQQVNASCSSNGVMMITAGMLRYTKSSNQIASILGHELAHCMKNEYRNEYQADSVGAGYMSKAGYSVCDGLQALKGLNQRASGNHPATIDRYRRLCK